MSSSHLATSALVALAALQIGAARADAPTVAPIRSEPAAAAPASTAPQLAAATSAQPRWSLLLGGQLGFVRGPEQRFFEDADRAAAGGLTIAYDVVPLGDGGGFALGAGLLRESREHPRGALESSLDLLTLTAEARLRLPVRSWFAPHVRLAAGATRGRAELRVDGQRALDDAAWAAVGSAGAGLTFRTRLLPVGRQGRRALAFSLTLEGGYTAGAPLSFQFKSTGARLVNGATPIQSAAVASGQLPQAFTYAAAQAGVHF